MRTHAEILDNSLPDLDWSTRRKMLLVIQECIEERQKDELDYLLMEVCGNLNVPMDHIRTAVKERNLTDARAVFCRRAKEEFPKFSWAYIGMKVGRDHAAALQAAKRAKFVKEIISKYDSIYARKTPITAPGTAVTAHSTGTEQNNNQGERRVLPHNKVEEGSQAVQEQKPALCPLSEEKPSYCGSGADSRSHNPEGCVSRSVGSEQLADAV